MARIATTTAPNLPLPSREYTPRQQEQISNVLRLYFNQVDNFTQLVGGPLGGSNLNNPFGMFMSSVDQTSAGVTSENIVQLDTVVLSNGVRVENNEEIRFSTAGQFLVTVSLQVTNRNNSVQEFELWAKQNGNNYPLSNTRFDIPERKSSTIWGHATPAVNGIFTVTNPTEDYLRMAWWSDSALVFLQYYDARTSPARPAIPSVIITVNQISCPCDR
jgi:hypothetical protein